VEEEFGEPLLEDVEGGGTALSELSMAVALAAWLFARLLATARY
jgi:hypothetical protein